jgi:hypothetical protein
VPRFSSFHIIADIIKRAETQLVRMMLLDDDSIIALMLDGVD